MRGGGGLCISNLDAPAVIRKSEIKGNTAAEHGGGLFVKASELLLEDCNVTGNEANLSGGAIYTYHSKLTISYSTFTDNNATNAGTIFNAGQTHIENSTIVDNRANDRGSEVGGIINADNAYASLEVVTSTIANNGTLDMLTENGHGQVEIVHTIIGSAQGEVPDVDTENWIGKNGWGSEKGDPMLLPLSKNGGPTLTAALNKHSPVLQMNVNVTGNDQRHYTRKNGNIGAYDYSTIVSSDFYDIGQNALLWHNDANGSVMIEKMIGFSRLGKDIVVNSSNTNLVPRGIGDFTGDGKPDIVLHNQNSGNLRIWEMDDVNRTANTQVLGSSNTNLHIAGVADFDGDGDADIATFNTNSGALRMWVMDGTTRVGNILVLTGANTNLVPKGAGDMDGDGVPDLVLRNNNTGTVRVWTMNTNYTRKGNVSITKSSNTNLDLRGVVDINGDGNNDILNYNTNTHKLRVWLMDGNFSILSNEEIGWGDPGWSVRN